MPSFPIQLKRNGTAAATPSSLLHGEVALNYADGKLFWKDASNVIRSFTFQAYAASSHTHAASDITSGTLDAARLPLATTIAAGAVIVGTGLGVSSGTLSVGAIDAGEVLSPPAAPTALSATAGNASLVLSWTAPAYGGSTSITGYTIEYTPSGGSASTVNTGSASTSYTLAGLTNGTAYTLRVRAVNSVGNGAYSGTATGTPSNALITVSVATTGSGTAADPYVFTGNLRNTAVTFNVHVNGTLYFIGLRVCADCGPTSLVLRGVQYAEGSAATNVFAGESLTTGNSLLAESGIRTYKVWVVPS